MKVSECMQSDVIHVVVPGTREDVLHLMAEQQINGVPVCKKGTKTLVGMITRSDLLSKPDENQIGMLMIRDPVTVTPRTEIRTAARTILERGFRRLPVVDKDELVGLVSIPDIIGAILENDEKAQKTSVKRHINTQIVAVWSETPLPLSYMIMEMAGKTSLVVLSEEGGIAGMISVSDYIRLSEVQIEDNISKTYSGTETAVEWGWTSKDFLIVTKKLLKLPQVPVKDVMVKNLINVSEVTSIADCVRILRKNDIDQAPVVSASGSLIGMIEDKDLLRLAAESL
jgi:CBS domain-containing protein